MFSPTRPRPINPTFILTSIESQLMFRKESKQVLHL
jgi:hypothetical protein